MPRSAIRTAAVAVALLGASGALADEATLKDAQAAWEAAFNAGDATAAAAAVFTEDARLLPPGAPMVVGREAVAQYWQTAIDAGLHGLDLGIIAVETIGDTMIETGTWAVSAPTDAGGTVTISGKALVIWKKGEDGRWRMSQDMWNTDEE